jgi:hypothetical protein
LPVAHPDAILARTRFRLSIMRNIPGLHAVERRRICLCQLLPYDRVRELVSDTVGRSLSRATQVKAVGGVIPESGGSSRAHPGTPVGSEDSHQPSKKYSHPVLPEPVGGIQGDALRSDDGSPDTLNSYQLLRSKTRRMSGAGASSGHTAKRGTSCIRSAMDDLFGRERPLLSGHKSGVRPAKR